MLFFLLGFLTEALLVGDASGGGDMPPLDLAALLYLNGEGIDCECLCVSDSGAGVASVAGCSNV